MMGEKVINVVPKWLNPYIKLDIINVDKYSSPRKQQQDDDVEKENRSNQAIEDYTTNSLRVVLERTKIYECKTCYFCYTTERDYRLHQIKHVKPDVDCKYSYQKYGNYVKKFKCAECDLRFVAESTLEAHSAVHRPFPHVCHCGIGFHKQCDLQGHQRLVHPEIEENIWQPTTEYEGKKPKSEFCIKSEKVPNAIKTKLGVIKPKPKLKQRKNKINNKVKEQKNTKAKRPKTKYGIIRPKVDCEEVVVDGKTKYICPTCNNYYASYSGLQIHFMSHTGDKPYKCDICSKGFSQSGALINHKLRHAGFKVECPVCKKKYSQKGALTLHMRIHTGEKPYDCEFCPKSFSDPSAFARHVRTHTGDKRYQCPLCPMRFSDASGLIQHKLRHAGKKMFKCEICLKKFYTNYDLLKHLVVHTGRYAYECDDCGRRYRTKATLYTHIVQAGVHSGFRCELCPRVMSTAAKRKRHMRAHQVLELADCECDLCGETFYSKAAIARHLRLDHNM